MSNVFIDVGVSLDGYLAGTNRGPGNPLGYGGTRIHEWMFQTASFLERIGLSGGETSPDDALVREVFERAGAYVMGSRMFDEGGVGWPENPPFRAPVFVLTHSAREPWPKEGGYYKLLRHRRHRERPRSGPSRRRRQGCAGLGRRRNHPAVHRSRPHR